MSVEQITLPSLPRALPRLGGTLTNITNITFLSPGSSSAARPRETLALQSQKINAARTAAKMPTVPQVIVDDEDMSGYVVDEHDTKVVSTDEKLAVLSEPKLTPRYISTFEIPSILGSRAERLQKNESTTCPQELIDAILRSSKQIERALAACEFIRRDIPVTIVRTLPSGEKEVLNPNRLAIKPEDREKVINELLPKDILRLLRKVH